MIKRTFKDIRLGPQIPRKVKNFNILTKPLPKEWRPENFTYHTTTYIKKHDTHNPTNTQQSDVQRRVLIPETIP